MKSLSRNEALLGPDYKKVLKARIAIIGLGGVGSHAAMALARMGVEGLILMDPDIIKSSNFNRHAQGFKRYLAVNKAQAIKEEILGFRDMDLKVLDYAYTKDSSEDLFKEDFHILLDCIDVVTHKLQLIEDAQRRDVKFISCLGTGNRLSPQGLKISSLYKTSDCPLARVIRREARKKGLEDFPVVLSTKKARKIVLDEKEGSRHLPASSYFTPAAAGQLLAYWAINEIINEEVEK